MMIRLLILIISLASWGCSTLVEASAWPYYSFEIATCSGENCSKGASYKNTKTNWMNISDSAKSSTLTTQLTVVGIHCTGGGVPKGVAFSGCGFIALRSPTSLDVHNSGLVNPTACVTTAADNFILKNSSACIANSTFRAGGLHGGAGAGAECMVLGKVQGTSTSPSSIETPFGFLTATQIANSRDQFCGKAIAPPANCYINVSNGGIFDHEIQSPNSISERSLDFTIDCGLNPQIQIVESDISLNDGRIHSKLSYSSLGGNKYSMKSVLTSINAKAGQYTGNSIVVVTSN